MTEPADHPAPSEPAIQAGYPRSARWLHWATFVFVGLAYLFINVRGALARGSDARDAVMQAHILAGIVVLALALPRLLGRLRRAPPPIVPPLATWERLLSRATHLALYAFIVVQPLLGLLTEWASGPLLVPFTSLHIASPLAPDHALHESLGDLHGSIGEVFYYIIGPHVAAAVWHHFFRHDDTLRRMLPP